MVLISHWLRCCLDPSTPPAVLEALTAQLVSHPATRQWFSAVNAAEIGRARGRGAFRAGEVKAAAAQKVLAAVREQGGGAAGGGGAMKLDRLLDDLVKVRVGGKCEGVEVWEGSVGTLGWGLAVLLLAMGCVQLGRAHEDLGG